LIQHGLGLGDALRFRGEGLVLIALSSVIYVYGGWPFLTGFPAEFRGRRPGMMTLIGVAISVAYFYSVAVAFGLPGVSFFWELVTLIDVTLARPVDRDAFGDRRFARAGRAGAAAAGHCPKTRCARQYAGEYRQRPCRRVTGCLVRPGAKAPVDGPITEGESFFNEASLTGESLPVSRKAGDVVIGGALNGAGAVTIEVKATGDKVNRAQASSSRTQDIANRAAG
jgi:Cu2+-exporting ATPase